MVPVADTVLVKTAAGLAEVARRSGRLSSLERRLLILINGQRTIADIADMLEWRESRLEFRQALTALERGHYIDRLEEISRSA